MRNSSTITNKRVLVGFSGGVDSTAAALLLRQQGYEVGGLFIDVVNREPATNDDRVGDRPIDDPLHPLLRDPSEIWEAASGIAERIGLPLTRVYVGHSFRETVIEPFCETYLAGHTPNPCIVCNPGIKFHTLLSSAHRFGYDQIATGHYARVERRATGCAILRARCLEKDQSYMLYRLTSPILNRLLLPLGEIETKKAVRDLVKAAGLPNAEQKDSQELCFVANNRRTALVDAYRKWQNPPGSADQPGDFVDSAGRPIGRHRGIAHYTIGQRKNLGQSFGKPMFVVGIDAERNTIVLGEDGDLFREQIRVGELYRTDEADRNWVASPVGVKIRSAAAMATANLEDYDEEGRTVTLRFTKPQRAPAPGQSAVFYRGEEVVGGGIIQS